MEELWTGGGGGGGEGDDLGCCSFLKLKYPGNLSLRSVGWQCWAVCRSRSQVWHCWPVVDRRGCEGLRLASVSASLLPCWTQIRGPASSRDQQYHSTTVLGPVDTPEDTPVTWWTIIVHFYFYPFQLTEVKVKHWLCDTTLFMGILMGTLVLSIREQTIGCNLEISNTII